MFDFDHTIIQENADVKILEAFADFNPAPNKYVLFSFLSLPVYSISSLPIFTLLPYSSGECIKRKGGRLT